MLSWKKSYLMINLFVFAITLTKSLIADEPKVDLIDAHGIKVIALVPPAEGQELELKLELSHIGRALLVEEYKYKDSRPPDHELFFKIEEGENELVVKTICQLWLWCDHLVNGKKYPKDELKLPLFDDWEESTVLGPIPHRKGRCSDGYWVDLVQREDSVYWRYHAGRELKGKRANIRVELHYDNNETKGYVFLDNKLTLDCNPRANSFEGEFDKRFKRSKIIENSRQNSFILCYNRLKMLLGNTHLSKLVDILDNHPNILTYKILLKPGPSAAKSTIKSIETMESKGILEKTEFDAKADINASNRMLVLPGAFFMRTDIQGKFGVNYEKTSEITYEKRVKVEYRKLRNAIDTERSAYLFLIALQQAITSIKYSTDAKDIDIILGDVIAEAEAEFQPNW